MPCQTELHWPPEARIDAPAGPVPAPPHGVSPARAAADLIRALTGRGVTGIYTAAAAKFAVISVTAELTVWTNGHQVLVHPSRPAPDLARRRPRNRCHAHRCPHPPGRRLLTNRPSARGTRHEPTFCAQSLNFAYQQSTTPFGPRTCRLALSLKMIMNR